MDGITRKIVHISTVHQRYDTRIFLKECRSLDAYGFNVNYIVADNKGNEQNGNISVIDIGKVSNRLLRMVLSTVRAYKKAVTINAPIYHLHDPELILCGLMLKRKGRKVIFDSHEDVPGQIIDKPYLNRWVLKLISKVYSVFESISCRCFDAIVVPTAHLKDKFLQINKNVIEIYNYPLCSEFSDLQGVEFQKRKIVCYIGELAKIRGIKEIITAMEYTDDDLTLFLGGTFSENGLKNQLQLLKGWQRVKYLGFLNREEIKAVLSSSIAGLVTLRATETYIDALPVKMFEYMGAGIPVIASDFPLLREIIEKNNCGKCVDPMDSQAIASAIKFFQNNPEEAQRMGNNGRKAILEQYNWRSEEKKLLKLYDTLNQELN